MFISVPLRWITKAKISNNNYIFKQCVNLMHSSKTHENKNVTDILVNDSLKRKKESISLSPGSILTWYSCGPTVYDSAHIGHASTYIRTDAIRRILTNLFNIDVLFVLGITDIDDKIIKRSKELNTDCLEICRTYEKEFFQDMSLLNVIPPTTRTRVTEHIPHIIKFVQRLVDKGMAYATTDGSVYFQVSSFQNYGQFGCDPDTAEKQGETSDKKDLRDFALWKSSKPGEPFWVSPWGQGRPGWHIECSVMASEIFGSHIDIHSGGNDLMFPHHENELAQSEAYHGCQHWCSHWIHFGHLYQSNASAKMSKSLKNTISISEMLKTYTANQFRLFCLLMPYRSHLEYSKENMHHAVSILHSWSSFVSRANAYVHGLLSTGSIRESHIMTCLQNTKQTVETALKDDFDFPRAIAALNQLVNVVNLELSTTNHDLHTIRSPAVIAAASSYLQRLSELFGITLHQILPNQSIIENENTTIEILDVLTKFRSNIRTLAVDSLKSANGQPVENVGKLLLNACDDVRKNLLISGVRIKDMGKTSTWERVEKPKQLLNDRPTSQKTDAINKSIR